MNYKLHCLVQATGLALEQMLNKGSDSEPIYDHVFRHPELTITPKGDHKVSYTKTQHLDDSISVETHYGNTRSYQADYAHDDEDGLCRWLIKLLYGAEVNRYDLPPGQYGVLTDTEAGKETWYRKVNFQKELFLESTK